MPYYVMVEVESEEEARELARHHTTGGGLGKLRAVWRKPTLFCDQQDGHRKGKTVGWTRGTKWGWWVCSKCGKPTAGWAGLWKFDSCMGFNLLPDSIVGTRAKGQGRATQEWETL